MDDLKAYKVALENVILRHTELQSRVLSLESELSYYKKAIVYELEIRTKVIEASENLFRELNTGKYLEQTRADFAAALLLLNQHTF
jgi:hypothetical protein